MALINCNFYSKILNMQTSICVLLPQTEDYEPVEYPALYLLHGYSDDNTIWLRNTLLESYCKDLKLAVIMPAVNNSFYTDTAYGHRYWSYISEELPLVARSLFHLSDSREDNFAAGLSMGGYGAFKLALRYPERFSAAASLSGSLDIAQFACDHQEERFTNIFGDITKIKGTENDLLYLVEQQAASGIMLPKLFQCCGTEDYLYKYNIEFYSLCKKVGLDVTYEEEPGVHEWSYWDKKIQRVLEWLPLQRH